MNMRRPLAVLVLTLGLLASWSTSSWAEGIEGRVWRENPFVIPHDYLYEEGVEEPARQMAVFIWRVEAPPGEEYEDLTFTDDEGRYAFHGLVPHGIYQLSLPFGHLRQGYVVVEQTPTGPEPIPPLPSGVSPGAGPPKTVDLPLTAGVAPTFWFGFGVPDEVVMAGLWLDENRVGVDVGGITRTGGEEFGGQHIFHEAVDITLTPIDPPKDPFTLSTGLTYTLPDYYDPNSTAEYQPDIAIFLDHPLSDGDEVLVSLDPDQPALEGYVVISPLEVTRTYSAGEELAFVEFRIRPANDLPGRVFIEPGVVNGIFDGADFGVGDLPLSLWDLSDSSAGAVATTTSGADGLFSFEEVPWGYYRVTIDVGSPPPSLVRQVYEDDPAPANFAFTLDTCPDEVPPEITGPGDLEVEATGPGGSVVDYTVTVFDACDPDPTLVCTPPSGSLFPLGTTQVECTATDRAGHVGTHTFEVQVLDRTAPTVACSLAVRLLWPANGRYAHVGLTGSATDTVSADPTLRVSVYSSDPAGATRRGPDAYLVGGKLLLRKTCDPRGVGRVYLVVVEATDAAGNTGRAVCTAWVPKNSLRTSFVAVEDYADLAAEMVLDNGTPPAGFAELASVDGWKEPPRAPPRPSLGWGFPTLRPR